MAKSKSKSKKNGNNNNSSAKNIKALIAQNKMIENQNAEAMREAEEKKLAREAAKEAKAQQEVEAENVVKEEKFATAEADEVIVDSTVADQPEAKVADDAPKDDKKDGKKDDKDKKKGKKSKKQREGLGKKVKDTASELKKVTWPSFKEVVKKTGIVFAVVIFFAVILLAFDFLMSLLYKLFIS